MIHIRDETTGQEMVRVETKRLVRYVYVGTSLCGLTRPTETLYRREPGALLVGDFCPDCLTRSAR